MIFDHVNNLEHYGSVNSLFNSVRSVINDITAFEFNKWIVINNRLKLIRLDRFSEGEIFEFHKKYIDVHITIDGIDELFLGDSMKSKLIGGFDTEKDYQLSEAASILSVKSTSGFFTAFIPGELHRNKFIEDNTTKVVCKLAYDA